MDIDLPSDVIESLPSPDQNGLVRVSIAMKLKSDDGKKASIVEINDVPCGDDSGDDYGSPEEAAANMKSPEDVASQILG